MAKIELVNSVDHQSVKINITHNDAMGDNIWYAITFPQEFKSVQGYYPIFFQKEANTGQFYPVALFGFQEKENLFLADDKWQAGYIPLSVQRQPFLIGRQTTLENGVEVENRVLQIDMNHPRVNNTEGEALFETYGGNSDYLDRMATMLETLHHGLEDGRQFINMLLELDLLEPFTLEVTLNDQSKHQMIGFYTINEDKLAGLAAETIAQLHQAGYLQPLYMAIASQSAMRNLLDRKNQSLGL